MSKDKFLRSIGVDPETIEALSQEQLPEDFNLDEAASKFIAKRREMTLNDAEIKKVLKGQINDELYPKMVAKVRQTVKKVFGITEDQLKAIEKDGKVDLTDMIGLGKESLMASSNQTADEIKKELFEARAMLDTTKQQYETKITEIQSEAQNKWTRMQVESRFKDMIDGMDLTIPKKTAHLLFTSDLLDKYSWDVDGDKLKVMTKDGAKVDDGKDFLSAQDIINRRAAELQILKQSNGGQGDPKPPKPPINGTPPPAAGEESDAMRALRERIESQSK